MPVRRACFLLDEQELGRASTGDTMRAPVDSIECLVPEESQSPCEVDPLGRTGSSILLGEVPRIIVYERAEIEYNQKQAESSNL